jgi:M6 family metalloprotease-like protein
MNKNYLTFFFTLLLSLSTTVLFASHHYDGQPFKFPQPDGSSVTVNLYGDDFYMRAETSDGYTVVRDDSTGWICYATLSEDKTELVSTGVRYTGTQLNNNQRVSIPKVDKHLDITDEARRALAKAKRQKLEGVNEVPPSHRGNEQTDSTSINNNTPTPAPQGTKENILGLTILIDFSDEPATIPQSDMDQYFNGDNYTGYGNNGSMKEYFEDVSQGLLVYENVVYGYFRAPKKFATYDNMPHVQGIREIQPLVLQWLDNQGFDFSTLTTENGYIRAINYVFTGRPKTWAQGMWHHKSANYGFSADGVTTAEYNTSPARGPLQMGTLIHENGHMVGGWPDTYKYDNNNGPDGIGTFDLMCQHGHGGNPPPPNPYFLYNRGWANIVDVTNTNAQINDSANTNTIYKYNKSSTEYYLIKARKKEGRSLILPDEGLTIWHVDENGDNQTTHHEVFLEHANNDNTDHYGACWHHGGNVAFNDNSIPSANWYDNTASGLRIWNIGLPGTVMTYNIGSAVISNDCNGDLGGLAFLDNCGVCAGGNTGIVPDLSCIKYCDAAGDPGTGSDFIRLVEYGTVYNNSTRVYYENFTKLSANFPACKKVGVAVTLGHAFVDDYCFAWVDWNKNGIFDANERTDFPVYSNDRTFVEIPVPAYAVGNYTMRLRNIYSTALPVLSDPCGVTGIPGEVEDYTINISSICNSDCNGDVSGTATVDYCNVCSGGNTGIVANSTCVVSCDTIIQAEDAFYGGGVTVETAHAGYNGTGFVNLPSTGGYIEFTIQGCTAGAYTLEYRYALGGGNRTIDFTVNGATQPLTATSTGAWTNYHTASININLNTGTNFILFESTGSDFGNLDQIKIKKTGITTSSSDIQNNDKFKVYPNPAQNQVNISGEFSKWTLTDALGAFIKEGTEKVVNVGGLNSGLYYLRVDGKVMKFIKI